MPLNQISCHWTIDAMSLDHTSLSSFYPTIFFMSLHRISCHWIVRHSIGRYFSCHWIGLHVIGSDFMLLDHTSFFPTIFFISLDQTSCHYIIHHSIGIYRPRHYWIVQHPSPFSDIPIRFHVIRAIIGANFFSGQRFIIAGDKRSPQS